jgi:hypothetical protein
VPRLPKLPTIPSWVTSRTVVLLSAATLLVIAAALVFTFAFTTGSHPATGSPTGSDSLVVLSVDNALQAEVGQDLKVTGYVIWSGGKPILASGLAQSAPPQAAGFTLPLSGLRMASLVGVNSVAAQTGAKPADADVQWTDYQVVLEGVIVNGVLEVRQLPVVETETSDNLAVRWSPVTAPINSGDDVAWALDVMNTGTTAVDLTFSDGQRGDLTLSQGSTDVYVWSDGKAFDRAVQKVTLQPGAVFPVVLTGTLNVKPGTYDVDARISGLAGPADSAAPLPDITTTIVVH